MKPLFWHVLIEMRPPEEKSKGGIVLTADIQEADLHLCPVGRVADLGPLAFKTKTSGGHDYAVHANDVTVGTNVLVARKIGVPIKMRDGRYYQLVNDYEILAVLTDDEAENVRAYV